MNVALDRAEKKWGGPIVNFSRVMRGIRHGVLLGYQLNWYGNRANARRSCAKSGAAALKRKLDAAGMTWKDYAAYKKAKAAQNKLERHLAARKRNRSGSQANRPSKHWLSL